MRGDGRIPAADAASIPTELVARLEAASVGSRDLDAEIWQALVECDRLWRHWAPVDENHGHGEPQPGALYYAPHCAQVFVTPEVTTSLDAALALAERVLGDEWAIYVSRLAHWNGGPVWLAHVTDGCVTLEDWLAPTPALALCIAILKATTAAETSAVGTTAKPE